MRPYAPTGRPDHRHFNPRIPYGMRHELAHIKRDRRISIHASRMGCDIGNSRKPLEIKISIHASRMGCDTQKNSRRANNLFQSTHPVWDATTGEIGCLPQSAFQSTHPVWDATSKRRFDYPRIVISIHASRMGCDLGWASAGARIITYFNPRIPYGMRPLHEAAKQILGAFQSTHPVWDATYGKGADADILKFQSTHPVWDATAIIVDRHHGRRISIHASRMGCDCSTIPCSTMPAYFNPRIPYGMRPPSVPFSPCGPLFQSTHPVWDATRSYVTVGHWIAISIHASRMGCDAGRCRVRCFRCYFNPRIPYGMRRCAPLWRR